MEIDWTHDGTTCPAKHNCTGDKESCGEFPTLVDRVNQAQRAFEAYGGGDGTGFEDFVCDVLLLGLIKQEFTPKDLKKVLAVCTEQLAAHVAATIKG